MEKYEKERIVEEKVEKEHVVRVVYPVEVSAEECDENARFSRGRHEISIEIPEGMELSEEELKEALSVAQNEIIDIIRATKPKSTEKVKRVVKRDEVAKWCQ